MTADPFIIGWEEWLSLPDLGVPAIKAKVDTGARTSALHAFTVEPFGPAAAPKVRFAIHPIPGRDDVAIHATADVVDRREVTSSNGDSEVRYVIRTRVRMAEREWPIEVTLTNRETMAYRMLLGRQAIQGDVVVDPAASFRQPKLSYKAYGARAPEIEGRRPLSIALLTRRPENATNRRIKRTAERRGHAVEIIDRTRVSLWIDARDPALFVDGRALAQVDAVIVRAGRTPAGFTLAVVRQLELLGAVAMPSSEALVRLSDPLAMRQLLARQRVAVPEVAVTHADWSRESREGRSDAPVLADSLVGLAAGPLLRFAVVGGRAIAAVEREAATALEPRPRWRTLTEGRGDVQAARVTAEAAAKALGVGIAGIDIAPTRQGPIVLDVTSGLAIAEMERSSGAAIVEALVIMLEQEVRGRPARA